MIDRLLLLLSSLLLIVGCAGSTSPSTFHRSSHPDAQDAPVEVVYHGTFSESKTKRLPIEQWVRYRHVIELWYPTTEVDDDKIEEALGYHLPAVRELVASGRTIQISAYSQGACLGLDLVGRLNDAELAATTQLVLISPAFSTYLSVPMTARMQAHCARAEDRVLAAIHMDPDGALAQLIMERTVVATAKGDVMVRNGADELPVHYRYDGGVSHLSWVRHDHWRNLLKAVERELSAP